jgi:ankyrin repeat protein
MKQRNNTEALFQTPLITAAAFGQRDAVEILIRNGANINENNVGRRGS